MGLLHMTLLERFSSARVQGGLGRSEHTAHERPHRRSQQASGAQGQPAESHAFSPSPAVWESAGPVLGSLHTPEWETAVAGAGEAREERQSQEGERWLRSAVPHTENVYYKGCQA